jgi:hypothetical protein
LSTKIKLQSSFLCPVSPQLKQPLSFFSPSSLLSFLPKPPKALEPKPLEPAESPFSAFLPKPPKPLEPKPPEPADSRLPEPSTFGLVPENKNN